MIRSLLLGLIASRAFGIELTNPIVFVTQMPIPQDFATVNSSFGNHDASLYAAGRGGDLWIRYPDGVLKNLTQAAGYGQIGMQGAKAIAVRDPSVHWNGRKLLFSMAIGAPTTQWGSPDDHFFWQIYELSGLGEAEKPRITRIAGQPDGYNNISPLYSPDGSIVFSSDRPRDGRPHLYPQRDEYELAPTATGLWKLTAGGRLQLLTHAPSGDFNPIVDSFGRVVFTRWDHLQQDQFARADRTGTGDYGTFNYASEAADAAVLDSRDEVFPEPLSGDPMLAGTHFNPHTLNHFFPWQVNPDGTELETLNHIGRHELHGYFGRSFDDDPALSDHLISSDRANQNPINNFLQVREDPDRPGRYYGIDAPEFGTHASGQIISIDGAPSGQPGQDGDRLCDAPRHRRRDGRRCHAATDPLRLVSRSVETQRRHSDRLAHVRDARGPERRNEPAAGLALCVSAAHAETVERILGRGPGLDTTDHEAHRVLGYVDRADRALRRRAVAVASLRGSATPPAAAAHERTAGAGATGSDG
ncbi:MAG: hypothetical protein U1E83_04120 [Methylotetracoccus sp.]